MGTGASGSNGSFTAVVTVPSHALALGGHPVVANDGTNSASATFTEVQPTLAFIGGTAACNAAAGFASGTNIFLNVPAPAGGLLVTLTGANSSVGLDSPTVTIPAGETALLSTMNFKGIGSVSGTATIGASATSTGGVVWTPTSKPVTLVGATILLYTGSGSFPVNTSDLFQVYATVSTASCGSIKALTDLPLTITTSPEASESEPATIPAGSYLSTTGPTSPHPSYFSVLGVSVGTATITITVPAIGASGSFNVGITP